MAEEKAVAVAGSGSPPLASSTAQSRQRKQWSKHLKAQSKTWGGNEQFYPTPQQLCREVDALHLEHELLNAEFQADASARTAAALEEHRRLAEATGFKGGPGPLNTKLKEQAYHSWAREQPQKASMKQGDDDTVELPQLAPASGSSAPSVSSLGVASGRSRPRGRVEPAKVRGPDGKIRLRGVKSTSDIARYCKDVDPYSKKNWAVREAFKNMRSGEHERASMATWGALRSWYTTDKTLDEWYSSAKGRRRSCDR
eukprot:TRINITY_DN98520_c0_g1_i1.p1 TRINITY_DN98520_c0_g1~~TRINITY_DN98520_c0_g1_i1.p1  ORF type:complete len:286 (+),score=54.39 TRINITY_DN98520_c0_g1_i1:94-858(+)